MRMSMDQSSPLERYSTHSQPNCFLYGAGPAIRAIDRMISHITPTEIPVLFVGEKGTGKEEIALELHYRSQRSKEPFLKFDCHQVPGQLSPAWLSQGGLSKLNRRQQRHDFSR